MNLVWIHCSEILAPEVMGILDECGLASYRVWKNVLSRDGGEGRTHWDDAVFPGKDFLKAGEEFHPHKKGAGLPLTPEIEVFNVNNIGSSAKRLHDLDLPV